MTPLMALLSLGLSVGTRTPVQAGTISRPTLWAEPGSLVPWGSPVTLWCQGTLGTNRLHLHKTGSLLSWDVQLPLEPRNRAKFSVSYMTYSDTGTYHCYYYSPTGLIEHSDPLELVVTGRDRKPSVSVSPSPVVASRETVTLQCDSRLGFDTFVLTQEDLVTPRKLDSQRLSSSGGRQAIFKVGPVTPDRRWFFRCYGFFSHTPQLWSQPSDPLQILVSGASRRPFLLSPQGLIVTPGQTPTLQCRSKDAYDIFALYKEKSQEVRQHPGQHPQAGLSLVNFTLSPVSASNGGRYRCIGRHNFTSLWSEPSDPVDILVEDEDHDSVETPTLIRPCWGDVRLDYTPTLSVEPGPSVSSGDNVTLLCQSRDWRDTFLLAKERAADPPLCVKVDTTEEITQAHFSFHPVTSAHNGTYRCYSSNSFDPYRLSYPSAPLQLQVSGPSGDSRTMSTTAVDPLLIGLSTAGALFGLFLLLFLLLLLRHCHQTGHCKSKAAHPAPQDRGLNTCSRPSAYIQKDSSDAVTHTQSEEGVQLNPESSKDEDPHGATYDQVAMLKELRRGVAYCTPLSGAWLNAQDQQIEEDTQAGGQAEAPEAPLEVTYAQLKHLDTAQESIAPPSSLSGEPPEEPSMYAALAFH